MAGKAVMLPSVGLPDISSDLSRISNLIANQWTIRQINKTLMDLFLSVS